MCIDFALGWSGQRGNLITCKGSTLFKCPFLVPASIFPPTGLWPLLLLLREGGDCFLGNKKCSKLDPLPVNRTPFSPQPLPSSPGMKVTEIQAWGNSTKAGPTLHTKQLTGLHWPGHCGPSSCLPQLGALKEFESDPVPEVLSSANTVT